MSFPRQPNVSIYLVHPSQKVIYFNWGQRYLVKIAPESWKGTYKVNGENRDEASPVWPGVLWTQTAILALVWWCSCQRERNNKYKSHLWGNRTKDECHPRSCFFPLKEQETKALSDLASWAPCWEGACVVVMVAIFSALVSKVAFEDSAGRQHNQWGPGRRLTQEGAQAPVCTTAWASLSPWEQFKSSSSDLNFWTIKSLKNILRYSMMWAMYPLYPSPKQTSPQIKSLSEKMLP